MVAYRWQGGSLGAYWREELHQLVVIGVKECGRDPRGTFQGASLVSQSSPGHYFYLVDQARGNRAAAEGSNIGWCARRGNRQASTHRPTRTWRPFTAVRILVFRITDNGTMQVFHFGIKRLRVERGRTVRRTKRGHYPFYGRLVIVPLDIVLDRLGGSDVLKELEYWER